MIVAVPFCAKDGHMALKNLNFCIFLEGTVPIDALLSYDTETPDDLVERVKAAAKKYFRSIVEFKYQAPWHKGWPQAANHAFQQTATHIACHIREPWLWWEADAVPLRRGWLTDIVSEYGKAMAANKCFMGHLVKGITEPNGHMNGVGVYPPDVGKLTRNAMLSLNAPWDVAMSSQMLNHFYSANHLFQHCWTLDSQGNCCNNGVIVPTFKSWADIAKSPHQVDFRCALFHRCKDGSLIDHYMGKAAQASVPQHMTEKVKEIALKATKKKSGVVPAISCRILIVTYWKDFPWLKLCLDAIDKFATGFEGVTVCIPSRDMDAYGIQIGARDNVKIRRFNEVEGKGMVHHMERMAHADELCPKSDFILHMDADSIPIEPVSPEDYIVDGKAVYVVRTYDSLIDKERGVISDCYQWKKVVEKALGEETPIYTMCRHPTCFPRTFYKPFREFIEKVQKTPFTDYVLAQKNEFPQTFADFPTMGAWAYSHFREPFLWLDVDRDGAPKDKMKTFWSHGGLEQANPISGKTALQEIKEVLAA